MAKKMVNFTIDEKIIDEFRIIANANAINMSRYVEKCIEEYIKKNKEAYEKTL